MELERHDIFTADPTDFANYLKPKNQSMPSVMTCHLCGGGIDISAEASRGVCGPVASINLHCQQCGAAFQGRITQNNERGLS